MPDGPTIDELIACGRVAEAAAAAGESPEPALCLRLARALEGLGDGEAALRWAFAALDRSQDFTSWQAAAAVARRNEQAGPEAKRTARLALLGSYTTGQLATLLWVAALRFGVRLVIHEAPYGQYRQELLDPASATYAFDPDLILVAVHAGELALPRFSASPADDVAAEVARWQSLWGTAGERSRATIVQHLFAAPPGAPFGHLGATLPGTRAVMTQAVNGRLAASAPGNVAVVDCERLAALIGKHRWFDARYWHLAKQAVALDALPLLARHTAAVIASRLGLGKKCLVLDLDNTLWGGIVGEDGLRGLRLGDTAEGEAFQAFQEAVLALKERGVILAVSSKNNDADAREVFERHEAMRIGLDDIAVFVADWRPKPEQLRSIADALDVGTDALVFVDDNPAEREAVRRLLPEVDVVTLPADPAGYVDALADYLLFEPASFTAEDAQRTHHYKARSAAAAAASSAETIEDFYRSLEMRAVVAPFRHDNLARVAQLVGKTNQFNVTTKRHSAAALAAFGGDPVCVDLTFRLRDRFADHGLIAVVVAFEQPDGLEIDTWLMSCRVIGRSLEDTTMQELCRAAAERGLTEIRGTYVPTAKNGLVRDLFARLGFEHVAENDGTTEWIYDLASKPAVTNEFIDVAREGEAVGAGA